jgi:putative transposase
MERQRLQTYLVTCVADQRVPRFGIPERAEIALQMIRLYDEQRKYSLHAAAVMPDHVHALITPARDHSIERCAGIMKGGISFRLRGKFHGTLWQDGYDDRRIRDDAQLASAAQYIARNPERRGLREWPFVWIAPSLRG